MNGYENNFYKGPEKSIDDLQADTENEESSLKPEWADKLIKRNEIEIGKRANASNDERFTEEEAQRSN